MLTDYKWQTYHYHGSKKTFMSNRLARETSPYLLQHADSPVDWCFAEGESE